MLGKGKIHNRTGRHPRRLRKSTAKPAQQKNSPSFRRSILFPEPQTPNLCPSSTTIKARMASNPTNHLLSEASERPCTQPLPLHNPHARSNNHGPDHVDDSKPRPSADKAKVRRVVSAAQCRSTCKVSPRFSHEYDVRVSTTTACRYALIKYISDKASKSEVLNAVPCGSTIVPFAYCT